MWLVIDRHLRPALHVHIDVLRRTDIHIQWLENLQDMLSWKLYPLPDLVVLTSGPATVDEVYTTVRILRARMAWAHIPIVVIGTDPSAADRLLHAGVNRFIPRTAIHPEWLRNIVRDMLQIPIRRARRAYAGRTCAFRINGNEWTGRIRDISLTGAFLETSVPLRVQQELLLQCQLFRANDMLEIRVRGRVVRRAPGGYGIVFTEMPPSARTSLERFFQTALPSPQAGDVVNEEGRVSTS